jgi:hypothetical protein
MFCPHCSRPTLATDLCPYCSGKIESLVRQIARQRGVIHALLRPLGTAAVFALLFGVKGGMVGAVLGALLGLAVGFAYQAMIRVKRAR